MYYTMNMLNYYLISVHGHLHFAELDDDRYFDVGLDKNNYEFVSLDYIKDKFKQS